MATVYTRPLNSDERDLMRHILHWGSDGYPIRKVGRRWDWSYRSLGAPELYGTKREAVESFETYMGVLLECHAAETMARCASSC